MSSSSSKKLVVVCGSTGTQGRSVVQSLLKDGSFKVRGITRKPDSESAKELKEWGIDEVVKADLENREEVEKAFQGAWGVFGLTQFWEPTAGAEGEVRQGKTIVDAAKATGVEYIVYSTMERAMPVHWISKADVADYLRNSGIPFTNVATAYYYENLLTFFPSIKNADGSYTINKPWPADFPYWQFSAYETGDFILPLFKNPTLYLNKDIEIAGSRVSNRDMAKALTEGTGKTFNVLEVPVEGWEKFCEGKIGEELTNNQIELFRYHRDLTVARELFPGFSDFATWAKKHGDKVIAAAKPAES